MRLVPRDLGVGEIKAVWNGMIKDGHSLKYRIFVFTIAILFGGWMSISVGRFIAKLILLIF